MFDQSSVQPRFSASLYQLSRDLMFEKISRQIQCRVLSAHMFDKRSAQLRCQFLSSHMFENQIVRTVCFSGHMFEKRNLCRGGKVQMIRSEFVHNAVTQDGRKQF